MRHTSNQNSQSVLTTGSIGLLVTGLVNEYDGLFMGVLPETHRVNENSCTVIPPG